MIEMVEQRVRKTVPRSKKRPQLSCTGGKCVSGAKNQIDVDRLREAVSFGGDRTHRANDVMRSAVPLHESGRPCVVGVSRGIDVRQVFGGAGPRGDPTSGPIGNGRGIASVIGVMVSQNKQ